MINLTNISSIIGAIAGLSVATERLVEIVKGMIPWLNSKNPDPVLEGRRQAALQILAGIAGIITTFLASQTDAVSGITRNPLGLIVIGLLASGGSGFWNSILDYVNNAKAAKSADAESKNVDLQVKKDALVNSPGFQPRRGLPVPPPPVHPPENT